jgi:hypothetical protein
MVERRGEVFIAPQAFFPPDVPVDGRMVDPATAWFRASWQKDGEEGTIEERPHLGSRWCHRVGPGAVRSRLDTARTSR